MLSLYHALRNGSRRRRRQQQQQQQQTDVLTHDILALTDQEDVTVLEMKEINTALEKAMKDLQTAESAEQFVMMRYDKYKGLLMEQKSKLLLSLREGDEGGEGGGGGEEHDAWKSDDDDDDDSSVNDDDDDAMSNNVADKSNKKGNETRDSQQQEQQQLEQDGSKNDIRSRQSDKDEEVGYAKLSCEERERRLLKLHEDEMALKKVHGQWMVLQGTVETMKKHIFQLERKRDIIITKTTECKDFLIASAIVNNHNHNNYNDEEDDDDDDDLEEENDNHDNAMAAMTIQDDIVDVEVGGAHPGSSGGINRQHRSGHDEQEEDDLRHDSDNDDEVENDDMEEEEKDGNEKDDMKSSSTDEVHHKHDFLESKDGNKATAE